MTEPSFETKVLVSLEEIKGVVNLVHQKADTLRLAVERHESDIAGLKVTIAKFLGAAVVLSIILPVLITLLMRE